MKLERGAIENELIGLLRVSLSDPPSLEPSTDLIADVGLESVQVIEYLCEVEDRFDLMIDEQSIADVRTIADLAEVVARVKGA